MRQQPQVAFRHVPVIESRKRTQNRNAGGIFNYRSHQGFLAWRGHPVEDHACQLNFGIKVLAAQDHGGQGPGDLGAVQKQHHRALKQFGQFGRRIGSRSVRAVIQTPVALDDRAVRVFGRAKVECISDTVRFHQVRVQIVTGALGGLGQPAGVNIIRAFFKGNDATTPVSPCGDQSQGYGGFAATAFQGGDGQTRAGGNQSVSAGTSSQLCPA